jgi:hypothetical protein
MTGPSETRETIAHSVLRRYLPSLTRIMSTASFCHVYRGSFTSSEKEESFSWEKKDISGSLFLCATSTPSGDEDYHLVILNRQSVHNFIWTLNSTECIEDDGSQLILSHTSGYSPNPSFTIDEFSCWGIWVFPNPSVEDERGKMLADVMYYAQQAEERKKKKLQPPPPPPPQPPQMSGYSIMDQIFPTRQPSPSQYAAKPEFPPYPTPQMRHEDMPQNGGGDVLGRLFESARQRSTPQPGGY